MSEKIQTRSEKQKQEKMISSSYEVKSIIKTVWSVSKIYLMWVLFHWMAVQFYQLWCVSRSLWGLILGAPIYSQMPQCRAALWVIIHSSTVITNMWLVLGTWIISKLVISGN